MVALSFLYSTVLALSNLLNIGPGNHFVQLPPEIWVTIFNFLPRQDQCRCAFTCTLLQEVFKNPLINPDTGCTVDFREEFRFLFPQNMSEIDIRHESFCKKIAANEIGGFISYKVDNQRQHFFIALRNNSRITQLDISNCQLSSYSQTHLTPLHRNMVDLRDNFGHYLKSLIIQKNEITCQGLVFLLKIFPQLEALDVSSNPIALNIRSNDSINVSWSESENNAKLKAIGTHMHNLKVLKMNYCKFEGNQVEWLVEFLKSNTKLQELHLIGNEIHDA